MQYPRDYNFYIFSSFFFLIGSYGVTKTNFRVVFQALKPECLNFFFLLIVLLDIFPFLLSKLLFGS